MGDKGGKKARDKSKKQNDTKQAQIAKAAENKKPKGPAK